MESDLEEMGGDPPAAGRRRVGLALRLVVLGAIGFWLLRGGGVAQLAEALASLPWWSILVVTAFGAVNMFAAGVRWRWRLQIRKAPKETRNT